MTIARVEQLFALACSTTSDEEARTAALAGVRLMKKLGLKVAEEQAAAPKPRSAEPFNPFQSTIDAEFWETLRKVHEDVVGRAYRQATQYPRQESPRPSPRQRPAEQPGTGWKECALGRACSACGGWIRTGERFLDVWEGFNRSALCKACGERVQPREAPPANPPRPKPPDGGRWIKATLDNICSDCRARIAAGSRMYVVTVNGDYQRWCERH